MEESELKQRIVVLEQKIDAMSGSLEKMRKYFLYTFIATIVLFVLPLIGLIFVIPSFLSTYGEIMSF